MAQEAVQGYGWLSAGEMADGLGLAETTPGPLIMVTQFVGYLAAFRAPEPFTPLLAGILGAGLTTWVTFAPCFLWIFTFAPWIERLENARWLKGGLATLTAAVVGVIANLTLWFALHVLFSKIGERQSGPVRLYWPDVASFNGQAALLSLLDTFLIFRLKWNVLQTLAVTGLPVWPRGGRQFSRPLPLFLGRQLGAVFHIFVEAADNRVDDHLDFFISELFRILLA